MPVQVIWRFELPVHHEESSRSDWKLYHLPTFLLMLDEGFRAPPKNQAWARLWHSHYNHEGGVNTGQAEGYTCHQCWSWKIQSSLGVPLLTLLTTFSIVFDCVDWWNSVFAWWCLFLWPCLIRSFVMIVGVLWVFYLQWHQLPRWVLLLYLPLLVILCLST